MIVAISAPDSIETSSLAALEIAEEWRRRDQNVQLVASEPRPTSSSGIDCTSMPADGVPTLRLGDDLKRAAASRDRTIVDCPSGAVKLQRAALSVADAAIILCEPGGDGFWPSGRMVEMARKAGEIRSDLHVGFAVTKSALRDTPADSTEASSDLVDLPIFESVLDISAEDGIRRTPSVSATDGTEMLVDELEEICGPSATRAARDTRDRRPSVRG